MRILTIIIVLLTMPTHAQNVINPWWGSIFTEGHFSPGEWDAAPTVDVPAAGSTCQVAVAVDDWGLFIGFMGHLESNQLFPEVLLDLDHDRTADWNSDDHWFHTSATNCHHLGAYGVFDDCSPLPEDWSAHPNFSPGAPMTDSVEFAIPWWYLLGSTPSPGDTIGFAVVLTNTATSWSMWPAGASRMAPSTWGHLVFPGATSIADDPSTGAVSIWPNPATDLLTVEAQGSGPMDITLFDAQGREVYRSSSRATGALRIPVGALRPGAYLLRLHNDDGVMLKKVFKL